MNPQTSLPDRLRKLSRNASINRLPPQPPYTECTHPGCGDTDRLDLLGGQVARDPDEVAVLACLGCPSGHLTLISFYVEAGALTIKRIDIDDDILSRIDAIAKKNGLTVPEPGKPCTCTSHCLLMTALDTQN